MLLGLHDDWEFFWRVIWAKKSQDLRINDDMMMIDFLVILFCQKLFCFESVLVLLIWWV
jgi:hypothetical protein